MLVTDKGEFHLSAHHPVMLKTGELVPIYNLRPGTSLMATSTYAHGEGYVRVAWPMGGGATRAESYSTAWWRWT